MQTLKLILTIINFLIIIALADVNSKQENSKERLGLWIFLAIFTLTTGLMWWNYGY